MGDETVASPCIDVCTLVNEVCVGCGRTIDEIVAWRELSAEGKRAVLAAVKARREADVIRGPAV